jgi:acyl-CoA synthetase (AMP-forming)/AMP-acid ligase II
VRTVRGFLDRRAAERPDAVYLVAPEAGREFTYLDLQREARKLCRYLRAQGLRPGDKVGFYCANGWQAAAIFLGTMYGGFVSVPLNLLAQPSQLEYVTGHSELALAFADKENAPRLAQSWKAAKIIVIDVDAPSLFTGGEGDEPVAVAEEDAALLMYTSGTTGKPKGCVLTQKNVVCGALFVQQAHALTAQDRVLSSLPLYHINGQIVATLGPMVQGGSVVAPHRFSVSRFWALLAEHRCTWFNVVPTIIAYLVWSTENRHDVSRVRFGRSASAPLPPQLHRVFEEKFGLSIIETFGMTETCGPCFANPLDKAKRKYGSVGVPVGNRAKVSDIGELMVKGDNVLREYYKNPEETRKAFTPDGWLRTGDLGYCDAEGFYFVTGRLKELIIKGGENIAPREIDDVLYKHPAVLEAAAVGIPDARYGQEILAAVVLKPGAEASEAELRRFCQQELGPYKTPKLFRFLKELPKGPSGKVQRLKLHDGG